MGKSLGTRQKLNFRIEPSQRSLKPPAPLVLPSGARGTPDTMPEQRQGAVAGKTPGKKPKTRTS